MRLIPTQLDGTFFSLAAPAVRAGYEAFGGMALAPGRGNSWAFHFGLWACYLVDVWLMLEVWLSLQGIAGLPSTFLLPAEGVNLPAFCAMRLAVFGISNCGSILSSSAHTKGLFGLIGNGKPAVKYALLIVNFASVFAWTTAFGGLYIGGLVPALGFKPLSSIATPGTDLLECINSPVKTARCINLG